MWLLPTFSLLCVPFSDCSGGINPFISPFTTFREKDFLDQGLSCMRHSNGGTSSGSKVWESVGSPSLQELLCAPFGAALG